MNETETQPTEIPTEPIVAPATPAPPPGTKHILLGREHDITPFASADEQRYVLQGAHYYAERQLLEATDGRMLIRVPVRIDAESAFPAIGDDKHLAKDCIIPSGVLKKTLASIPKSSLPILNHVVLSSNGAENTAILTTCDLDVQNDARTRCIEGTYPTCDAVMPTDAPSLSITLDAERLGRICDYAKRHSTGTHNDLTLEFSDGVSPLRFRIKTASGHANGLLMPMREA